MFEHFGGDEADTGSFAILQSFDAAAIISRDVDRIEEVCVNLEIGVQQFGEVFPTRGEVYLRYCS
jgi:hypothetical protein